MKSPSSKKRISLREKWIAFALIFIALASAASMAQQIRTGIEMVRTGRGLETFRTFWLIEFNWIGFLTLIAGAIAALLIGLGLRLFEHLERRKLMKKYPPDRSNRKQSE
jgi:hypothetical protein